MQRALMIFRRDLRLQDNIALHHALKQAEEVVLSFIFTPQQIENNSYRGDHSLQFMLESLEELSEAIHEKKGKLHLFYGEPEEVVARCIGNLKIDAVFLNRDYTPYSLKRDRAIEKVCEAKDVGFYSYDDLLLHPFEETLKLDGKPYTVFTPFYRHAQRLQVPSGVRLPGGKFYAGSVPFSKDFSLLHQILPHRSMQQKGGRKACLNILKKISTFSDYKSVRDLPAEEGTTHLSAHLKFNTCSIREVYHAIAQEFGPSSDLIRSLYWREFFTAIAFHFPHVFKGAFHPKFDALPWKEDRKSFHLWCEGRTGVPIVDAGMREMNTTGFMHNRVRMIAASFLIKDLHLNWRWGEKYFAQTLIDYDPAVNNGNWQWVASTGCDSQPYFRVFNPWIQGKKFDPDCRYIKKWVPELASLSPKQIHDSQGACALDYPPPLADHAKEAKKTLSFYRALA